MRSGSQESLLHDTRRDMLDRVLEIFLKYDLDAAEIGKVTGSGRVVLFFEGKIVADLPAEPLSREAPLYDRPRAAPPPPPPPAWPREQEPSDYGDCLRRILESSNVAQKSWIWTQYDHMVGTNTVERPGGDAAIVRVKGTARALALKSDVNPFFCALDPYRGAAIAVAEAARSIACAGAMPLAITDCLNFGNPEKPEVMGQFEAAVRGIADACRALEIPVVSGNVSFYNETDGRAIPPTPTIGMVGLLEDVGKRVRAPFARAGDVVALLGETRDELGGSEFLRVIRGRDEGPCPEVDLEAEKRLVAVLLTLAGAGHLTSAHDLADGGLAVALAECAMGSGMGANIACDADLRPSALLFGETTGRALVAFDPEREGDVREAARTARVPFRVLGRVGGERLRIAAGGRALVDDSVASLRDLWTTAFSRAIEAAD